MVDLRFPNQNKEPRFPFPESSHEISGQPETEQEPSAKLEGENYPGEVKDQIWQPPADAESVQHFNAGEVAIDGPDNDQEVHGNGSKIKTSEEKTLEHLLASEGTTVLTDTYNIQNEANNLAEL